MPRLGVALDLGTSGLRAQALDLGRRAVLSTAVTARHPLPGANVIDHLHFAVDVGVAAAQAIFLAAVGRVIRALGVEAADVVRLAVCGNPIQLSLFEGIEIRDLAYAGRRKLDALGVVAPDRNARVRRAGELPGLALPSEAEVLVPPAVRHEIGADALAMMMQTGMLERDEVSLATDYGTNAEIALRAGGVVYTGSTAAGPALEGQHIEHGLLALPGALCDVEIAGGDRLRLEGRVLDERMETVPAGAVDPTTGVPLAAGAPTSGITGTGVVALLAEGLRTGLIRRPRIETPDRRLHLPGGFAFSGSDLKEAGKAVGAVRAGHLALCREAGIRLAEIETAYMSGASGTYVNALKAQAIGLVPPCVRRIYQVGNTSLAMARALAVDPDELWHMQEVADHLRERHCLFAESPAFEKAFVLELSLWTEGLSPEHHARFLAKYGLTPLPEPAGEPEVVRTVATDLAEVGEGGLAILGDVGERRDAAFDGCTACGECVRECPEAALCFGPGEAVIRNDLSRCAGTACRRCERVCPERVFDLHRLFLSPPEGS